MQRDVTQRDRSPRRRMSLKRGTSLAASGAPLAPRTKSYSLPDGRILPQVRQTTLAESLEDFDVDAQTPSTERRNKGKSNASQRTIEKRVSVIHAHPPPVFI